MQAGTETSSTTLKWILLFLALNQVFLSSAALSMNHNVCICMHKCMSTIRIYGFQIQMFIIYIKAKFSEAVSILFSYIKTNGIMKQTWQVKHQEEC